MNEFRDDFTGIAYQFGPQWLKAVRRVIADQLLEWLKGKSWVAADAVAKFWNETYYGQLFPLRFGFNQDNQGLFNYYEFPFKTDEQGRINLEEWANSPLRQRFLDKTNLPPLLPVTYSADKTEATTELLADRLLTQSALVNLLLRQEKTDPEILHDVRLACLVYPLKEELSERLQVWPRVNDLVGFWRGEHDRVPVGLKPELMASVRQLDNFAEAKVGLGSVGFQRIKRYVFESPGLNEIRGASTLLDDLTIRAKDFIGEKLGPEVVLRAVGSTVLFLVPSKDEARRYTEQIAQAFQQTAGAALVVTAATEVEIEALLNSYSDTVKQHEQSQAESRATGSEPVYETLPFETRCQICRIRPAEGWEALPDGPVPLCQVCQTKRELGLGARTGKARQILGWLDLSTPGPLGVAGLKEREYLAQSLGWANDEDKGFIPVGARRPLLATIYGDGNNFGAAGKKLTSMALGRQWTRRVEKTTQAAAAVALARATQETAVDRGWQPGTLSSLLPRLPFQMLALGGDDLSLIAWAPVGIRFAPYFLQMTDQEFSRNPARAPEKLKPIAFSLGVLVTHHKASVRRTVAFAEDELMAWAKQSFKDSGLTQGNLAPLLADTLEQIPDDLKRYRQLMYRREGAITLYLTLRPFPATEMEWLLQKAKILEQDSGAFRRMTAAFVQGSPLQAMLHYIYQQGRFKNDQKHWLHQLDQPDSHRPVSLKELTFPATLQKNMPHRKPFGLDGSPENAVWFTPLWDLLELLKVLE